jgi:hypothetical protein
LEDNGGLLTNSEVIEALKHRGADKQLVVSDAHPSEHRVYQALIAQQPNPKTREQESAIFNTLKQEFPTLSKQEIVQILNARPSTLLEINVLVGDLEKRLGVQGGQKIIDFISENYKNKEQQQ